MCEDACFVEDKEVQDVEFFGELTVDCCSFSRGGMRSDSECVR